MNSEASRASTDNSGSRQSTHKNRLSYYTTNSNYESSFGSTFAAPPAQGAQQSSGIKSDSKLITNYDRSGGGGGHGSANSNQNKNVNTREGRRWGGFHVPVPYVSDYVKYLTPKSRNQNAANKNTNGANTNAHNGYNIVNGKSNHDNNNNGSHQLDIAANIILSSAPPSPNSPRLPRSFVQRQEVMRQQQSITSKKNSCMKVFGNDRLNTTSSTTSLTAKTTKGGIMKKSSSYGGRPNTIFIQTRRKSPLPHSHSHSHTSESRNRKVSFDEMSIQSHEKLLNMNGSSNNNIDKNSRRISFDENNISDTSSNHSHCCEERENSRAMDARTNDNKTGQNERRTFVTIISRMKGEANDTKIPGGVNTTGTKDKGGRFSQNITTYDNNSDSVANDENDGLHSMHTCISDITLPNLIPPAMKAPNSSLSSKGAKLSNAYVTPNSASEHDSIEHNNHNNQNRQTPSVENMVVSCDQRWMTSPLEEEYDSNTNNNDGEDASNNTISSNDNPTTCLPLLPLLHNTKRKISSVHDVAKQITNEHQIKKERIDRIGLVRGDIEKLKEIWVGDIGFALFIPFDFDAFTTSKDENIDVSCQCDDSDNHRDPDILSDGSDKNVDSDDDFDEIMLDNDPDMELIPPLLSMDQMKEINRRALPPSVRLMTWKRAYSLKRDGDYFGSFYEKCSFYKHTLIVIKTADGDLLGGYADTPWGEEARLTGTSLRRSSSFFGGGRAFLFATCPDCIEEEEKDDGRRPNDSMFFYPWTGENEYSQICDVEKGSMGMGGGGSFGWFVQNDFTVGSSGNCFTFGNPPLTKGDDGHFNIVDVEVYGFSSLSERLSSGKPSCSSFGSYQMMSPNSVASYGRRSSISSSSSSIVSMLG